MKNIDLEIKKMLGLLESKMGDVKPLVMEQSEIMEDDGEISFTDPNDWLKWLVGPAGCLTNKNVTNKSPITNTNANGVNELLKAGINVVKVGEPYINFLMNDRNGDKKQFLVFGKRDSKGNFLLIKRDRGKTPEWSQNSLKCPELSRAESFVSDVKNLSLEQKQRLDNLVSQFGIKETGAELTTVRPTGKEGYDFVPVDLSTGKGTNGEQYIEKTAVDGLEPEFKKEGQYYVWAKLGKSVTRTNVVAAVEDALVEMGYTRTEPTDALAKNSKTKTTLGKFCGENPELCNNNYPLLGEYVQKYGGDLPIWKTDSESYKGLTASAVGGRKSRREIKNVMNLEANRSSCQTAVNVLWNCMKSNSDDSCEEFIKSSFGSSVPYISAKQDLEVLARKCETNNVNFGRQYEDKFSELKTSTSKFSPFSKENLKAAESSTQYKSLEESLSRNIRLSLKEMRLRR
jgi:hypothetical protein